ncbi:hypothetical protein FPOAC1_005678 [Fusarium poae]|uniref:hypothetical protein n=1 Tax=Fusarium poae TaxID=36050 RepID=UPI001CEAAF34|nr:hypothetical protein FPOAC1_005678 [Fusarium poae]KAG8672408.1 hypothetical protein FPOAC1_005678 [Fusarium poae]
MSPSTLRLPPSPYQTVKNTTLNQDLPYPWEICNGSHSIEDAITRIWPYQIRVKTSFTTKHMLFLMYIWGEMSGRQLSHAACPVDLCKFIPLFYFHALSFIL